MIISREEREAGLQFARNWREANKAEFDRLYPPKPKAQKLRIKLVPVLGKVS